MLHVQHRRLLLMPALGATWLALLTALLFLNPLIWLAREWQDNPYYEHGPLVPLVSVALAALALPCLLRSAPSRTWLGPILLVSGLALRVIAASEGSDFLGALALLVVLAGIAAWCFGAMGLHALAFPLGYLLFAIPMPFMDDLGFYFQRLSTILSTLLTRLIRIPATYQGAEISLPNATFIVGVQCSGLYSTVTLTALGLLFLRMLDLRSTRRKLALLAAIPLIAIIANVIRLSSILAVAHLQSSEMAINYYHNWAATVFWLLAMLLLFALGKGLEWTQTPEH